MNSGESMESFQIKYGIGHRDEWLVRFTERAEKLEANQGPDEVDDNSVYLIRRP